MDGDNLPPWEQSVLIKQMADLMKGPPSSSSRRYNAVDIARLAETLTDE